MNKVRYLSVDELKQEQIHVINEIYALAKSKGLSNDDVEPIPDGVNDVEAYVKSEPRVMWVLKEPYDNVKSMERHAMVVGICLTHSIKMTHGRIVLGSLSSMFSKVSLTNCYLGMIWIG